MQDDPARFWQDLTANYAQMSDGELLELADKPEDLTDVAQQVLRDEMSKRRLTKASPGPSRQQGAGKPADIRWEPVSYRYEFADNDPGQGEAPHEYTWKTKLCDCETGLQAIQLARALQREGIDTWIQASRTSRDIMDVTYPRVLVAADQLEHAQAVADRPIPQDIIDDSMDELDTEPQDFEIPRCPKCGAPDPVLCPDEEIKPGPKVDKQDWTNKWVCESCGAEWAETEPG